MKVLLDTHFIIWASTESSRLPPRAKEIMGEGANEIVFSPVNLWEISIKNNLGRRDFQVEPHLLRRGLIESGYEEIPITSEHGIVAGGLPLIHRDPFDRMLIAQAMTEGFLLLTNDEIIARYPGPIRLV